METKFKILDKISELELAISSLSLDDSLNNGVLQQKISILVNQIKEGVCNVEDQKNENEMKLKPMKSREKVFLDGADQPGLRMISFFDKGMRYVVTGNMRGEINLYDLGSHLAKNTTCYSTNIFQIAKLDDMSRKFVTCSFADNSKLVIWSISMKSKLEVENKYVLDYKVRNIKYLQGFNLLCLFKYDKPAIDFYETKIDNNFSTVDLKLSFDTNFSYCNSNYFISNVSGNNFLYLVAGTKEGGLESFEMPLIGENENIIELKPKSFTYNLLENKQVETVCQINEIDFAVGCMGNKIYHCRIALKSPLKVIVTVVDYVSKIILLGEDLIIGADTFYVVKVSKNKNTSELAFSLTEKINSGYQVDDFVVLFDIDGRSEGNDVNRASFFWINAGSKLLRVIASK